MTRGLLAGVRLAGMLAAASLPLSSVLTGETTIAYRFTFPEPQHHWMAVEATFSGLPSGPLDLRMSRSSPGRYATHDFAKNVYDVEAVEPDGRRLDLTRPDPSGWMAPQHGPAVTVRYKVFGDRVDGTYLGVDPTHAHINMPASIMWARGMDDRALRLTFVAPDGARWEAATQLYAGSTPFEFTAPNLQYLMDSPVELGPVDLRQFSLDGRLFRFAAHHNGSTTDLDRLMGDVAKIVATERDVFGEFPAYEPGTYTFIADYLPWAIGDGMEHRNSTIMTSSGAISANRSGLLGTVAHEFFHNWNVERIRPQALEPFDFDRTNMSGELWLAEGFTQYYGPLSMSRAGVVELRETVDDLGDMVTDVPLSPGREARSAEEMSRMAPFTDGGPTIDRTNWSNSYLSYYSFGGAIALALDLTLRERYDGRLTLDDFMRRMWSVHGQPAAPRPGYVAHPYTMADAERRLEEVTGDAAFARDFFARFIQGRDAPDFAALLKPAGLVLQKLNPGRASLGALRLIARNGLTVAEAPPANSPAYRAGVDIGDEIRMVDGTRISAAEDLARVLQRHAPRETVTIEYLDRTGQLRRGSVTLQEDPSVRLVAVESTGMRLSEAQAAFRLSWLGRKE